MIGLTNAVDGSVISSVNSSGLAAVINLDALTGAMSRQAFVQCLSETIENAQLKGLGFALLSIDIDNMKHFNAHNGHLLGDELLKRFVGLTEPLLPNSRLLFRFGGDEFKAILPNSSQEEALHLSQKICDISREQLAPPQPKHCGDTHCMGPAKISVSISISLFETNMDIESLFLNADQKMGEAKLAGKDCVRM